MDGKLSYEALERHYRDLIKETKQLKEELDRYKEVFENTNESKMIKENDNLKQKLESYDKRDAELIKLGRSILNESKE